MPIAYINGEYLSTGNLQIQGVYVILISPSRWKSLTPSLLRSIFYYLTNKAARSIYAMYTYVSSHPTPGVGKWADNSNRDKKLDEGKAIFFHCSKQYKAAPRLQLNWSASVQLLVLRFENPPTPLLMVEEVVHSLQVIPATQSVLDTNAPLVLDAVHTLTWVFIIINSFILMGVCMKGKVVCVVKSVQLLATVVLSSRL